MKTWLLRGLLAVAVALVVLAWLAMCGTAAEPHERLTAKCGAGALICAAS